MNPTQAMSLFLRTWRAEWAGLSRAQLAIAVNGRLGKRGDVTERVVQRWEEGQPPASAEELLALCEVMERHGLGLEEVGQFREAVFAACAARHYPGLLEFDDIAHRTDVDDLARALYAQEAEEPHCRRIVPLVAWVKALESGATGRGSPLTDAAQQRRQRVAVVYLRAALAPFAASWPAAARMFADNATLLEADFGPAGFGGRFTVLGQRVLEAWVRAHSGRSPRWSWRLMALSEEAEQAGDRREALRAFLYGVHSLGEVGEVVPEALSACGLERSMMAQELDGTERDVEYLGPIWAALGEGDTRRAEGLALRMLPPRSEVPRIRGAPGIIEPVRAWAVQAREVWGWLAAARGDYDLAEAGLPTYARAFYERRRAAGQPVTYRDFCQEERIPQAARGGR